MIDPAVLNIRTTSPDGRTVRWGGKEPDAERIPQGLTFGSKVPGGFDTATCSFGRELRDWPDLGLFDAIEVYGQGGLTAWEGRQAEHPGDSAARSVSVNAVGWSAHLLDDPSLLAVYVDRDPSSWEELTQAQQLALEAAGHPLDKDFTVSVRRGGLAFTGTTKKDVEAGSQAAVMYVMPSSRKADQFRYRASQGGGSISNDDAAELYAGDDDTSASLTNSYPLTVDNSLRQVDLDPNRKYLMLRLKASVDHNPGPGAAAHRIFKSAAVYDNHGLKLAENDDPDEPPGVLASDVVVDALSRGAPLVRYTRGAEGSIEETDFPIPHLVFREQVTPSDIVQFVNGYHLFDWGVGEKRLFFFRSPTHYRRRWVVRQSEGATVSLEGPQTENSVNGVVVQFTDERGQQKTAGPPGSGCDYTRTSLADEDPENPVNAAGIPRKWASLALDFTTTSFGAIQIGERWLDEAMQTPDRGAVSAHGFVWDSVTGVPWPAWCVQAGDSIRVSDADNRERRIVEASYSHDDLTLTATLDNLPHQIDAIMERMGVELIGHIATT